MLKNADPCGDVLLDEALKHIKVRTGTVYLPDTGLENFRCVPGTVPYPDNGSTIMGIGSVSKCKHDFRLLAQKWHQID